MQKNEIFTSECAGYTSEGAGVCRIDGRAVFVPGLIEGETAEVRILKVSNTAVYGKIERLLNTSPERVEPDCPVYGKCGGCAVRHMSYAEELRFKRQKVQDCLARIGGIDIEVGEIIGAGSVDGYRNKTIFTVGEGGVTGFYRQRSHDLVPAPECNIESDYARRVAGAVSRYMRECKAPAFSEKTGTGVRRVMARYGFESGEGQAVVVTGKGGLKSADRLIEHILSAAPETVSIMRNVNPRPGDTVLSFDYERLWGRESITDRLCGLDFDLSAGAFYQVNRAQAERLYNKALEYAGLTGSETVLDLYCGTGTITLCLAKRAKRAIGCEIVEAAIVNAEQNAKNNGVRNAEFICADAEKCADELFKSGLRPDVVCVDPPRKGLSPEVPGIIAKMAPERVVYVSCDPATLARDLKAFGALGYKTLKATPVDMFPRTAHVETVCCLYHQKKDFISVPYEPKNTDYLKKDESDEQIGPCGEEKMDYMIADLTREEAAYVGGKINEIVPREVDADEEVFVLKVENDDGEIIGGCVAEAYEYHWSRVLLEELWVDERYRRRGIGSVILREVERIAREKGCRVVTLGTASYMARPFYEKHGYTVFTTLKRASGFIDYSLVKYLDRDTPDYVPTNDSGTRFRVSFGNEDDADTIQDGLDRYGEAYEPKYESIDFYKKLVDKDGGFAAGVIAEVKKGAYCFVDALFVEEPLRRQGLGTYLLKEAEEFAKENGADVIMTGAGDWNVDFFKKNGYLLRGELKDVPREHDCYELYKMT